MKQSLNFSSEDRPTIDILPVQYDLHPNCKKMIFTKEPKFLTYFNSVTLVFVLSISAKYFTPWHWILLLLKLVHHKQLVGREKHAHVFYSMLVIVEFVLSAAAKILASLGQRFWQLKLNLIKVGLVLLYFIVIILIT